MILQLILSLITVVAKKNPKIGPQPTNMKRRKGENGEKKITIVKTIFHVEKPENGKKSRGERGCTSLYEKDYNSTVTNDRVFDCFFLLSSCWRRGIYTS